MVRDGYFYGFGFIAAAVLVLLVTGNWIWAVVPFLLACFFFWFFRDPQRPVPVEAGLVVSPADGKITEVARIQTPAGERIRLSIFLSVFDVHVNRSPIAGTVREVRYQKGKHLNALNPESAEKNEQNVVTVQGDEFDVTFSQIAGILARRIVFRFQGRRFCGARPACRPDQVRLPGERSVAWPCARPRGSRAAGQGRRFRVGRYPAGRRTSRRSTFWRRVSLEARRGSRRSRAERKRRGRLRRGMYIVPSLFTSGNIAAGYFAITQSLQGSVQEPRHFDYAALAIGFAIPFDAIDGRIARMTKTTSDFGKELDSLADVITFGVAPSLLAFTWGFQMLPTAMDPVRRQHVVQWGAFVCFLFLLCGAGRLARFNIGANLLPTNPGRPGRKYFVGMPIPAAAGVIAAVVHFFSGTPVPNWRVAIMWMMLVLLVGLLMVSTWRFWSGKEINLADRHPFQRIVLMGLAIYATVFFSQIVLFAAGLLLYVFRHLRSCSLLLAAPPQSRPPAATSPEAVC